MRNYLVSATGRHAIIAHLKALRVDPSQSIRDHHISKCRHAGRKATEHCALRRRESSQIHSEPLRTCITPAAPQPVVSSQEAAAMRAIRCPAANSRRAGKPSMLCRCAVSCGSGGSNPSMAGLDGADGCRRTGFRVRKLYRRIAELPHCQCRQSDHLTASRNFAWRCHRHF